MRSAGTTLWFLDPGNGCEAVQVGCPTSITGLDSTIEQIETTCLESTARTYEAGLATPGTATFTLNLDPQDPTHTRLLALKAQGVTLQWAIGFPESQAEPTGAVGSGSDDDCEWTLPTSRTWVEFEGFVNSFAFDWSLNATITASVGIQVSGDPVMIPATT
jgi:hypothetical protein